MDVREDARVCEREKACTYSVPAATRGYSRRTLSAEEASSFSTDSASLARSPDIGRHVTIEGPHDRVVCIGEAVQFDAHCDRNHLPRHLREARMKTCKSASKIRKMRPW